MQNGSDPECKHFQKIADVGHYRSHKSTRQGIYVCTASGILLGSMNTHNTQAVLNMMNESLEKYAALGVAERKLPADSNVKPTTRPESNYPDGGLDLTMTARDLPKSCNPQDECHEAWNQDRVWFSKTEARQFLPAELEGKKRGDQFDLPRFVVERLARFSVIDTAKGQTSYYKPEEVEGSIITATIETIDAVSVRIRLQGKTEAESPESRGRDFPHGIETSLLGHATFDLRASRFTDFEIVALGSRRGRTVFNGRHRELEDSPIGFVFQLTSDNAPLIAPSFLFAYPADWAR